MALHVTYMWSLCKKEWLVANSYRHLCPMVWRRISYNSVPVYVLTSSRVLRLTAFARRWQENNGRVD